MNELQEVLCNGISIIAEGIASKNTSTLTIECIIKDIINTGTGEYKIEYLGNAFNAYASNPNIEYNIGDKIYVLIPDGDFSKQKIIIGLSTPSTLSYNTTEDNKYMQVSDNLFKIEENEIELCSYKSEIQEVEIGNNFNFLFPEYLKKYNTFAFSAMIRTEIPTEQQVNGNYGLKLKIPFYTLDAAGEKISFEREYVLDVNNILGNPYRLTEWSYQHFYITISSDEKFYVDEEKEIKPTLIAFVENFAQAEKKDVDIFMKDISFNAYDELPQDKQNGYYLHLSSNTGNYFFEEDNENETKILTPNLKINGRDIRLSNTVSATEETYKCYWFKEDASIKVDSEDYSSIGGIGWKCLNQKTNIGSNEDGSQSFDLITNQYSYTVLVSEVLTSARFKCVIVINKKSVNGTIISTPVSNIITLENIKSNFNIKVSSVTGSNSYIKNIGEVNLTCDITYKDLENPLNNRYPNYIITYEWNRYDKNGKYLDNNFYTVVSNKDEKKENLGHYISQQVKFATSLIEDANIFTCSAYINYIYNNINYIKLLGTESILIDTNGTAAFNLSIQNGDVLYKYDTEGDSPLRENYDGPLESRVNMIKPLAYTIYKADGTELTDSEYKYCQTTWLIPINSLITVTGLSQQPVINEEYYSYSGVGRFELNYTLANIYNFKKTNNTIILKVKFGEIELTAEAAIKIVKEGENGTNSSNYSAVIEHYGATYGEYHNNIIQKFQVIYCAEGGTFNGKDYAAGWYYHNLNYKINNLPEIESFAATSVASQPLEIKIYRAGEVISTEEYSVEWSLFDEDETNPCLVISSSSDKQKCFLGPIPKSGIKEDDIPVNIIQAKITISSEETNEFTELYAYYPIEIIRVDKFDYLKRIIIEKNENGEDIQKDIFTVPTCLGGYSSVLYASDGTNPKYNSSEPFICTDAIYNNNTFNNYNTYTWSVSSNLVNVKTTANQATIKPCSKYNSSESKNYIKVSLILSEEKRTELQNKINSTQEGYDEKIILINKIKEEQKILQDFFTTNYVSEISMIEKLDSIKSFINKRANKINALNEVEKRLNLIYDYSTELAKVVDKDERRKKQIENVKTQLRTVNIENGIDKINEINIENINEIKEKNKKRTLTNLSKDYNNALEKYNNIKLPENNLDIIKEQYEEILSGLLEDSNLYLQILSIQNKLDTDTDECCITYVSIKNDVIGQTYKLLSQYGDSKGLNENTINYYNNLISEYESAAAADLKEITRLKTFLIEANAAIIYIRPIIMLYNRYELSDIVGWDGNKLYTGGEGQESSYLYAPRVGAGKKEEDESFTGIVIGNRLYDNKSQTGLFGYHMGISSIFLDAETGSATFGKSGASQIIIDPAQNKAILKSGNYDISKKTGMQIDLTTPEIRFGSGNFVVNSNGHITAKGGGSVGSWQIEDTVLKSGNLILDAKNKKIYSDGHSTLNSTEKGFYLGPDGLSIGKTINIDSTENGSIKIGRLSNESEKYWTINGDGTDSYIKYGTKDTNFSVYIGTDKISLGTKFSVDDQGALKSESGSIGGWIIGENTLKSEDEKLTLNASGSISSGNWNINSDGTATFSKVTITSDESNVSTIGGIDILYGGGLRSATYNNSTGYQISHDGSATFRSITAKGRIDATSGSLENLDVEGELRLLDGDKGKITFGDCSIYALNDNAYFSGDNLYMYPTIHIVSGKEDRGIYFYKNGADTLKLTYNMLASLLALIPTEESIKE